VTLFEVWAPAAESRVDLHLDGAVLAMDSHDGGWWRLDVPEAGHGSRYAYAVDGDDPRPDPRSLWQPDGVHEASAVFELDRFSWSDAGWTGVTPGAAIAYELHVGTFTSEGTLDAAIGRLNHLAALGVTLVELLPMASFDGPRGWGYDGVALWAVQQSYGGPEALLRFVDAAHARGLAVCVDAVYNHLGPSGNYLSTFGPYFTETHHTPWGAAVNLDAPQSDEVREFLLGSALSWLRDFHVDVLRLDAVHALVDTRALTFLEELSTAVDDLAVRTGREIWLVAESDQNDPRTTAPRGSGTGVGGLGIHAQWVDDVHHSLFALLTGESSGYYADFAADPAAAYAKVSRQVFFHDATYSSFRGRAHGRPVDAEKVSAHRFWGFLNDHDQIGNRAVGDRMSTMVERGVLAAGAALLLTSAFTPMLFMGEEWGARTPWQFFTSFADPELAKAVSTGRRGEFALHGWNVEDVPDPQAESTFTDSTLDWSELEAADHQRMLAFYTALIALRRSEPGLTDGDLASVRIVSGPGRSWIGQYRGDLLTVGALTAAEVDLPRTGTGGSPTRVEVLVSYGEPEIRDGRLVFSEPGAAVLRLT
jgi:maltooligosyltrehalose trehalohydrolase